MTEHRFEEPIAIIGIGCRFPGHVDSPASYWDFLLAKGAGIREVPEDRWSVDGFYDPDPTVNARSVTKWGGFLDNVRDFDPNFFEISPREANAMDPQQRLLLQIVYEAAQDAGITLAELRRAKTGVFAGVSNSDYGALQRMRRTASEVFAGTGAALSIVANRVSHRLDLSGPSFSVDTACSSSLVALDQACWSLDRRTSTMAIAAGVNILVDPSAFIAFSKAGMLSPTGTISTFDAAANGYVRGEGVGAVILKRLSDAERDGDRIYAVIRATSVNQDGHTPTLTAPSAERQTMMLETLCERAGLAPSEIHYAEAHGTGTPVGDPIEASAIGKVFGAARDNGPVYVGSVKPNIGHLESAAGISGLIKSTLIVHHRQIPPNKNFAEPSPRIAFDALNIKVPTEAVTLEHEVCRAAVNSFGFGGTNASALVETYVAPKAPAARPNAKRAAAQSRRLPFVLSAATTTSLRNWSRDISEALAPGAALADVPLARLAVNLAKRRDHFKERAVLLASSAAELRTLLGYVATDSIPETGPRELPAIVLGQRQPRPQLAFTFAGQGGQWWGMARRLLDEDPVFKATVAEFDDIFMPISGWSVVREMRKSEKQSRVDDPAITQPAIFAVQIGLAAMWRRAGITPDMIIGHSFGEVAAAYVAGALSLPAAANLIHKRGLIADHLNERGAMAAVGVGPAQFREIAPDSAADIAAVNGAAMITVSGREKDIAELEQMLAKDQPDVFFRRLAMNIAWHSRMLEPAEEWFRSVTADLEWTTPKIPMISTVTGRMETCFDSEYWWRNLRQPVAYEAALSMAFSLGAHAFVELGPHRTLSGLTAQAAAGHGVKSVIATSLIRDNDDFHNMAVAAATLYGAGFDIDWTLFTGEDRAIVKLPRYPWDAVACWVESEETRRALYEFGRHPLLGARLDGPQPAWQSEIDLAAFAYLGDHKVGGDTIFPAAGYIDMMLAAGRESLGEGAIDLENFTISEALFIGPEDSIVLRTQYDPHSGRIQVSSHLRDGPAGWVERASGRLRSVAVDRPAPHRQPSSPALDTLEREGFYWLALQHTYQYGTHFQGVASVALRRDGLEAKIVATDLTAKASARYATHPAILDSCLQAAIPLINASEGRPIRPNQEGEATATYPLYLPIGARRIRFFAPLGGRLDVSVAIAEGSGAQTTTVYDETGSACLVVEGFTVKRMDEKQLAAGTATTSGAFFEETFVQVDAAAKEGEENAPIRHWLVLEDEGGLARKIASSLKSDGVEVTFARRVAGIDLKATIRGWMPAAGERSGIIFAWPLDTANLADDAEASAVQAEVERNVLDTLAIGQALDGAGEGAGKPALWVLTERARVLADDPALTVRGLAQAPLVAMTRTIGSECPENAVRHLDIGDRSAGADKLVAIIKSGTPERELVERNGVVSAPRVQALAVEAMRRRRREVVPGKTLTNFGATMEAPGSFDAIELEEVATPDLGAGMVRVAVEAVGLNFRDIMAATGLLPAEAEPEPAYRNLGLEYGGTIVEVGAGVTGFRAGDRVMGMGRRLLQGTIVVPAASLSPLPKGLSAVDGATIPSAFATAHYALNHVGRIARGERILIHVATGGVGIAAIQLAQRAGAVIFATAGSDSKRDYLRSLGIEHVYNSRSLDFADGIRAATGGEGVDLVLNSLPGAFIEKGLDLLRPFGRFLEIGKRDVYADLPIGMRTLRSNISLSVIDLAAMGTQKPEILKQLSEEVGAMFAAGELKPLPATEFPIAKVGDAFRFMSQARHVGKVVVTIPREPLMVVDAAEKPLTLSAEKSYLVTGGSRGFGLTVADFLSQKGAGRIILASRSGKPDADAEPVVKAIEARGTEVTHLALDIADSAAVRKAVSAIEASGRPLGGIVHGAAVIIDGFLNQLTDDTTVQVLRPKTQGAWNLHKALAAAGARPEFFVSFSSLAQVLGSAGQANYVAANGFLDALAVYRRGRQQVGQAIDWGSLGESGFVARSGAMTNYLESMGLTPIANADAMRGLEIFLNRDVTTAAFAAIDWQRVARAAGAAGKAPRLQFVTAGGGARGSQIRSELASAPRESWEELMRAFLIGELAKVLRRQPEEVPADAGLSELGFDSLSSIELKNRVEGQLGITIPVAAFLRSPTVTSLATALCEAIEADQRRQTSAASQSAGESDGGAQDADGHPTHHQLSMLMASTGPMASEEGRRAVEHVLELQLSPAPATERLADALASLAARHPALRLRAERDSRHGYKLTQAPASAVVLQDGEPPLPGANGELFAATLAQTGRGRAVLVLRAHSAALDAASLELVADDFLALLAGEPAKAPAPSFRAALKRRRLDEQQPENSDAAHWTALTGASAAPVPIAGRKRALTKIRAGANRGATAEMVLEQPWPYGKPVSAEDAEARLTAAFARALADVFGAEQLSIDVRNAGREASADRLVGPFDDRFPVTLRGLANPQADQLLRRAARDLQTGRRHAALGTAYAEEIADDGIAGAAASLRQFGFAFIARPAGAARRKAGELTAAIGRPSPATLYDIDLEAARAGGKLRLTLRYDSDVLDAAAATRLGESLAAQIGQGAASRVVVAGGRAARAGNGETRAAKANGQHDPAEGGGSAIPVLRAVGSNGAAGKAASGSELVFDVTPNQRHLLDTLISPDCTASTRVLWNVVQALIVKPGVDQQRLRRAFEAVTARHDSLRMRFMRKNGAWRAVVDPVHGPGLQVEDLGAIGEEALRQKVEDIAAEEFDVERGPLCELRLLKCAGKGDALVLRLHHSIGDGWSLIQVFEDLLRFYFGADPATGRPMSMADHLAAIAKAKASPAHKANLRYWRNLLEPWIARPKFGRLAKGLPLNQSDAFNPPAESLVVDLSADQVAHLRELGKRSGASLNTVFMAALSRTVAARSGAEEAYISTLFPRRTDPAFANYVGYLVADIPVRTRRVAGEPIADAARRLQEQIQTSFEHVDLATISSELFAGAPRELHCDPRIVCSGLAPEHIARGSSLAPLLFGNETMVHRFGSLEVRSLPVAPRALIDEELAVRTMIAQDAISVRLAYEALTFDRSEAEAILREVIAETGIALADRAKIAVERFGAAEDWQAVARGEMPKGSPIATHSPAAAPDPHAIRPPRTSRVGTASAG